MTHLNTREIVTLIQPNFIRHDPKEEHLRGGSSDVFCEGQGDLFVPLGVCLLDFESLFKTGPQRRASQGAQVMVDAERCLNLKFLSVQCCLCYVVCFVKHGCSVV